MIYSKIWGDYYALTYRHSGQLISSHLKANEVGEESGQLFNTIMMLKVIV
jgi:hypothetical protein